MHFAVLQGRYSKVFNLLHDKIRKNKVFAYDSNVILFNSFDGANHLEILKGKLDLVSFSSTIFTSKLLKLSDFSILKSNNISLWVLIRLYL